MYVCSFVVSWILNSAALAQGTSIVVLAVLMVLGSTEEYGGILVMDGVPIGDRTENYGTQYKRTKI